MCGITGSTIFEIKRNHLNLMSDRGPDQRGLLTFDGVSLGHTRLSIIDTSGDQSKQPIEDEEASMVFNGEIYNFPEISFDRLGEKNPSSDSRVLFECIRKDGIEKTLPLLNGMFSFCYHDKKKNVLYLVRDRLGKKPLFYLEDGRGITFSSSLRLIRKIHENDKFLLNKEIVSFYFSAFYIPSPHTIYENVKSLQPGSFLKYDLGRKTSQVKKYWDPEVSERTRDVEEFDSLIKDATRIRLRADVPFGSFLSGGIDSTIVCNEIKNIVGEFSTYTAGIEDSLNEESYAEIVSRKLNTKHHVKKVRRSSLSIKDIRRMNRVFGQPFADSSMIPTDSVCDSIADDVTVAISGDGSDEIFMGYDKYLKNLAFRKRVFRNDNLDFLKDRKDPTDIVRQLIPNFDKLSETEKTNQFDIRIFLEGDILQKIDRISMSRSLEVRSPFLDYRIVELALGLPIKNLISEGEGKFFLKKRVENDFGREFAFRRKTGFMLSIDEWRSQLENLLSPLSYLIKETGVFSEKFSYLSLDSYTLFSIVVFLSWIEEEFA